MMMMMMMMMMGGLLPPHMNFVLDMHDVPTAS